MLVEKSRCTGCGTCAVLCPNTCISMKKDEEGFYQPEVDSSICVQCGICEKFCPVLMEHIYSTETMTIAVKNKNITDRMSSSSGGVFPVIAEKILKMNGYVCAAIYDENYSVRHILVNQEEQIDYMRGAKYVQSTAWHCFPKIRELLCKGKKVLFVGTPCQVAGLSAYLKQDYPNLLLVDMVCHGVPSEKVWNKYLGERNLLDAENAAIRSINLRSKKTGWSKYSYSVEVMYDDNTQYSVKQNEDWYLRGFVENLYLRKSCSLCKFKGINRVSDLTLGDYWGIWNQYPEFDDNLGVSLLLIHSIKGKKFWDEEKNHFDYVNVKYEEAVKENPSALHSSVPHKKRDEFFQKLDQCEGVISLIKSCLVEENLSRNSIIKKIMTRLKRNNRR